MMDIRVQQAEGSESGLACLAAVAWMLGDRTDLATLRARFPTSSRGMTLSEMSEVANAMNLSLRQVSCEVSELGRLPRPAILEWGVGHYVVFDRLTRKGARIFDPAFGWRRVTNQELRQHYLGVAAEVQPTPAFKRKREAPPLNTLSFMRWTPELTKGMLQILPLSIFLQLYVLVSPFYMRVVIDEAVVRGDLDLLSILAIAFGLFAVFNIGAGAMRGVALQKLNSLINWDMTRRTFHHLVRLPLPWFQRRRLADVLTRFQGLDPIRNLMANGLIAVVVDGLLSVTTIIMMFVISPILALVTCAALAIFVVLRLVAIPVSMQFASTALQASIAENGKRIETLRAIQTLKVMAAEPERENDWSNKLAEQIRTTQDNAFVSLFFSNVQTLVTTISTVIVIYLGARQIIAGEMTVGLLFAFSAYQSQFIGRSTALFEQVVSWKMLALYTSRLSDIVLTPVERNIDKPASDDVGLTGKVELRNVAFQYSPRDPLLLRGVNLTIEPGEFIAITGPSGGGKTTLLKILCGLYPPSMGEVLLDDLPIQGRSPRAIRRAMGIVMQEDELLLGTISENVGFFGGQIEVDRVWECLRLAGIDNEVRALPYQADTPIGDMGLELSGGQKQRILLARALYRRPRILVLDEATSHLDLAKEKAINDMLRQQKVTRIVVAHRVETIMAADRYAVLNGGQLKMGQAQPQRITQGLF